MASEAAQEDLTEFVEMWGFFVTVDTPVSYTHLDVYKRQLLYFPE